MSNIDIASYNRQGKVFCAANTAAKNHIAVTTSMTGLILYNPGNSNKKFIIHDFSFVWTTAPAAVHNLGLAIAPPNPTVPSSLTAIGSGVKSADASGNVGVGLVYDAATLAAAPTIVRWVGGAVYGSGVGESPFVLKDQIDGALVLVPGAVLTSAAVTTTLAGMASITWVEVPA